MWIKTWIQRGRGGPVNQNKVGTITYQQGVTINSSLLTSMGEGANLKIIKFRFLWVNMSKFMGSISNMEFISITLCPSLSQHPSRNAANDRSSHYSNYSNCPHEAWMSPHILRCRAEKLQPHRDSNQCEVTRSTVFCTSYLLGVCSLYSCGMPHE